MVRFHNDLGGDRVLESDVLVASPEEWRNLPQSRDERWQAIERGRVVIALRCLA
ncbi:hypothetical protein ACYOEI_05920 [Singulisphaera rosea]